MIELGVAEAWIGFVGVVIGSLVTFGATYFFEWRREKADARAARGVARSELGEAAKAVEDALSGPDPKWPPGWDRVGWSESWSTYRPVLAATMNDTDFTKLARAYLHMRLLQTGLAGGERGFVEHDKAFLDDVKSALTEAKKALDGRR
jgi:hypothetical protein